MSKQVSARWRVNAFRKAWSAAAPGHGGKLPLLSLLPLDIFYLAFGFNGRSAFLRQGTI